ncbi:MAG: hypothetical protein IPK48_07765 [Gammaproteobacteria bacterium]|nr:hypothetical protein [Gammaproteobacteria bacterium]
MATLTPDKNSRYQLKADRYGHGFKLGSTWFFYFVHKSRDPDTAVETAISNVGMTARVIMRQGSESGDIILTLDSGITLGGADGSVEWKVMPVDTVKFTANTKVFLDIELTPVSGEIWQSPTFWFKTLPQVTTP